MKQELTVEQLAAIQTWATSHGRTWKAALRHAWETGDYVHTEGFANSAALQQIRNTFGPSWLISFRLPAETPAPAVIGSHYDYQNQAWTIDGRYIACGHPDSPLCGCYGSLHAGELASMENLPTAAVYVETAAILSTMHDALKIR